MAYDTTKVNFLIKLITLTFILTKTLLNNFCRWIKKVFRQNRNREAVRRDEDKESKNLAVVGDKQVS